MEYELFKHVALAVDIPEHSLKKGDVARVVEFLPAGNNSEPGYALEVFNAIGDSIDVLTVAESELMPLAADEIWHVRHMAESVA